MITPRIIQQRLSRIDWWSAAAAAVLMAIGVLFIYSAAFQTHDADVNPMFRRQILWCAVGAFCYLAAVLMDYRRISGHAWWLYAASLVLLVLVLFIGYRIHGAYRWIRVFGVNIQPSEIAKLSTVILLARYLARPGLDLRRPGVMITALAAAAVPFLLIVMEPDLGTAAVLVPVVLIMLFVAGVPVKYLLLLGLIALLFLPLGWQALNDYQRERILVFIDPGRDPLGAGWNKIQSEIAVGSGGLWGKGFLKGTQNILGFLPRTVAPTDFIFSVIAEEAGFAGGALVLGLYSVVLVAGAHAAAVARDRFGRLLVAGFAGLVFVHVFVNVAMTIGLMPITGLPLPLISYGGSFMVSTMVALGLIQSVYVRRFIN